MIVADNTNVKTGRHNEIITQFQRLFFQNELESSQLIGCQQHILNIVLRVEIDEELLGNNTSLYIHY